MLDTSIISIKDWKQFKFDQVQEDVFSQNLDIVLNNTDNFGRQKHQNALVYKVFSSFLTHNYNYYLYETIHFLKCLSNLEVNIWDIMVMSSTKIKSLIMQSDFVLKDNKAHVLIGNSEFVFTLKRIPTFLVVIDFWQEFLGIDNLILQNEKIIEIKSQQSLAQVVNNISKDLYSFFKQKLPSSHSQKYASSFIETLESMKNTTFDNISHEDVNDETILEFWKIYSSKDSDIQIKTFKKIFELSLRLKFSIKSNSKQFDKVINSYKSSKPLTHSNFEDKLVLLDSFYENNTENDLSEQIDLFDKLQEEKINLIKKSEISLLNFFKNHNEFINDIHLSFLRNIVFSEIQNKFVEAERRGSLKDSLKSINDLKECNLYKDKIDFMKAIIENCMILQKIIFLNLWESNDPKSIIYIDNFLDEDEKKEFQLLISNIKSNKIKKVDKNMISSIGEEETKYLSLSKQDEEESQIDDDQIDVLMDSLKNDLEKKINNNNFKNFKIFLKSSKKLKFSFRRQGLRAEDKKISSSKMHLINESIKKINNFLSNFLDKNEQKDTEKEYDNDFFLFMELFKQIHMEETV